MKPAVARFVIVAVLFAGCMIYQAYLALTVSDPIILSRPQIMVADGTILAKLEEQPAGPLELTVLEARPPQGGVTASTQLEKGKLIRIVNLDQTAGWRGPGNYLIPVVLNRDGENYSVPDVPAAPGHSRPGQPRIYLATPDTDAQFRSLAPQ